MLSSQNFVSHAKLRTMRSARDVAVTILVLLCTLLVQAPQSFAQSLVFDRYHNLEEITAYMQTVAANHEIASYHELGYSQQGRIIDYLVLTNGSSTGKPVIHLNATHHGNEKASTESLLGIIQHIVANQGDSFIDEMLDFYALHLLPVVNPDGHARNTRGDTRGRDPNRDYSFPERDDAAAFKLVEIAQLKELLDEVNVVAAAAYHSGMEGILWPWCYSSSSTADHGTMREVSRRFAGAMDMRLYTQSYYDYPTRGEFIDYMYMTQNTLALTVEVSEAGNPPARRLAFFVERTITGTLEFFRAVREYETGTLDVSPRFDDRTLALN